MKLLIVDDEPSILRYLEKLLTDSGHHVLALSCNTDAEVSEILEDVEVLKFDVALVGLMMPAVSGAVFAVQIKRLSPLTKIIITVEPVPPQTADGLRREGLNFGQLPAPFEREELFRQLSAI